MTQIQQLVRLRASQDVTSKNIFFKTAPGQYASHDQFLGVSVPELRSIARAYKNLPIQEVRTLLTSSFNEERLLALFILVDQYKRSDASGKDILYDFYLAHVPHINNWNLVDSSAHLILGMHVYQKNKDILLTLIHSDDMWSRRIALVATLYFIRQNEFNWTLRLAALVLHEKHDLIHKAAGWMLREVGERDGSTLRSFLDTYAKQMPRTMLRYAIEKYDDAERKKYMAR